MAHRFRIAILLAGAVAVASCGGGDGGGAVTVVPGGSAPAPTPSPSPTGSPTPSPSASYDTAFDLSRDRSFTLTGAELTAAATSSGQGFAYSAIAAALQNPVVNPSLSYVAATQQLSLTLANGAPQVFDRSQVTLLGADRIVYSPPTGFVSFFQPGIGSGGPTVPLRYVIGVVQSQQTRNASSGLDILERRYVGGSATLAQDVPVVGQGTYAGLLTSYGASPGTTNSFNAQTAELAIDYAAGTVAGTITATSTSSSEPASTIVFAFSGRLGTTAGGFAGTVTTPDGGSGTFSGMLYGPQGVEVALVFTLARGEQRLIGTVAGTRR